MSNYGNQNSDNRQKLLSGAIIAIVALLAINAFLLYNKAQIGKENNSLKSENVELTRTKISLDSSYASAMAELETMKGNNVELNQMIEQQKNELKTQKSRIDQLLVTDKNAKAARAELANMKSKVSEYLAQIETLKSQNAQLTDENTGLVKEKTQLTETVRTVSNERDQVVVEKGNLTKEKQNLEIEKAALAKKVRIGSAIKVTDLAISTFEVNSKGKESKARRAKNIERIKACGKTSVNEVVPSGTETFYMVIMSPRGEPMQDASTSGTVKLEDGTDLRYTTKGELEYSNGQQEMCTIFSLPDNVKLEKKQEYKVFLYNKGFKVGETMFKPR
jgi:predicted nuclease with TOPRIM domain